MITNDEQLAVIEKEVASLEKSLETTEGSLGRAALGGKLADLQTDLTEYRDLQESAPTTLALEHFEALPATLRKARIASGRTQAQLAEEVSLGLSTLREYEETDYAYAELPLMLHIARRLELGLGDEALPADARVSAERFLDRLQTTGLGRNFWEARMTPRTFGRDAEGAARAAPQAAGFVLTAAVWTRRVFGLGAAQIFSNAPLVSPDGVEGVANDSSAALRFSAVHARYLVDLVLTATPHLKSEALPSSSSEVRAALGIAVQDRIEFSPVLDAAYDCGVVVLPLVDSGPYEGACVRVDGRQCMVVRQETSFAAFWLHDLLERWWYLASDAKSSGLTRVFSSEVAESGRPAREALRFVGNTMLNDRAEEVLKLCQDQARGKIPNLEEAVEQVADREGVSHDALATHLAHRLAFTGTDWWPVAGELVSPGSPRSQARDRLLKELRLTNLEPVDRDILMSALHEPL